MKTTKARLLQLIKEELEVILTDDEAVELFGDEIKEQINEFNGGIMSADDVPFVPLRQSPRGDLEDERVPADDLYDEVFAARQAVDNAVRLLDNPEYDAVYEMVQQAFNCLGNAMNALIEHGANPPQDKRTVAQAPGSKEDSEMRKLTYIGEDEQK
tara:strand:- start:92325 stop:92792 length:468 start_codon:yes stop_codon:yes gene_type:complete